MSIPVAAPPPSEITVDTFKEWTRSCGVRQVQREYEKLAELAHKNDRNIPEEMRAHGFKDFHTFSKACPQFSVTCWPTEFAELGSGFVMYFHFLAFLSFVLLVVFLIQIPSMTLYSRASSRDRLSAWEWNDWHVAFSTDADPCRCIGTNYGLTGTFYAGQGGGNQSYGTFCSTWDLGMCPTASSCAVQTPGRWLCQSWCFAGPRCSTLPATQPSMTNQPISNALVRAYSTCRQDATVQNQCLLDFRNKSVTFSESIASGSRVFIDSKWLTPGNFGPDQADDALIPALFTICVIVICGLVFVAYTQQAVTERFVDASTTSPNDFAVLVRGLPATATDERALMQFFMEHAVKGKTDTQVLKVVIGWDAEEFREKLRQLKTLRDQLQELSQDDPQAAAIKKQMASISSDLDTAAPGGASRLRSSGVVVVIFRYQSDMRACLRRWTGVWATFYSDAEDVCWLPAGNGLWKGAALPKFPIGDPPVPVHALSVDRAPNPGDIMWEELGVDVQTRIKMLLKTNGIMLLLLGATFGITYGFNRLQEYIKEEAAKGSSGTQYLSFLPALCVAIMNGLLGFASRKLAAMEYHETSTDEEFSQAIKMSCGMILNTAGIVYFVNATPQEWYQSGGLVNDIFTMLLVNALVPPVMPYFDLGFKIRGRTRKNLKPEMLAFYNDVLKRGQPKTPEQAEELKQVKAQVEFFKRAYAPSAINNPRRYANALKTFICCLFYMPVLPWVPALGCAGLMMQYWVDKYLLLRWYKRPEKPASSNMAMFSLRFIKFVAPVGLSVTFFVFLSPSWNTKNDVLSNFIVSIAVGGCFIFLPLSVWTRGLLKMPCLSRSYIGHQEQDYYKAQYMWSKEMKYHKDQFIYKLLPESKNPEFLSPGTDPAVKIDDVKATYGAATAEAVEAARIGATESVTVLKTGRVVGSGSGPSVGPSPAVTPSSPGPGPAIYGARIDVTGPGGPTFAGATWIGPSGGSPVPAGPGASVASVSGVSPVGYVPGRPPAASPYVPSAVLSSPAASAPDPGYIHVGMAAGSGARTHGPTWEYEVNHGYTAFGADCQEYIEKKYCEFKDGGGRDQLNVRTTGISVSVNFRLMTTKKDGSHKIRTVRRKEAD